MKEVLAIFFLKDLTFNHKDGHKLETVNVHVQKRETFSISSLCHTFQSFTTVWQIFFFCHSNKL